MGQHRPRRPARSGVFVVLVAIAVAATTWISISVSRHQDDEKHAAVAQANGIADPILALCNQGGDVGARLAAAGLCEAAAGVKATPYGPPPDAVTQDQVQALVRQELAKRPTPAPVGPTQAQIAAAVQAFIAANPDMFKAPAPTQAQIQAAVAAYLRTHPIQQSVPVYPQYDMPGLGGFSGAPGEVWPQPWPRGGPRAPR